MIDIKLIRENPELVKENIKKKFQDEKLPLVDEVIQLDKDVREAKGKGDALRAERNRISKEIGFLMKQGKKEEAEAAKAQVKEMGDEMEALEKREAELAEEIKNRMYVIPNIIAEKKALGVDKTIRIWSAGCSTGEEPYTIAILMKEICPPDFKFQITASDISLKSLMVGQKGFYTDTKVDGVPSQYLAKYFTKVEDGYQVKKELMDTIRFDYHNLKNDSGARNLDIIFCRNVLIYFDEPAQLAVINRFYNSMGKHSYLYIGHSESLFGMNTKFEFLKTQWACLYQKNEK